MGLCVVFGFSRSQQTTFQSGVATCTPTLYTSDTLGLLFARPQEPVSLYTSDNMELLLAHPQEFISLYTSDTVSLGLVNFLGCDNLNHGFILSLYSAFCEMLGFFFYFALFLIF